MEDVTNQKETPEDKFLRWRYDPRIFLGKRGKIGYFLEISPNSPFPSDISEYIHQMYRAGCAFGAHVVQTSCQSGSAKRQAEAHLAAFIPEETNKALAHFLRSIFWFGVYIEFERLIDKESKLRVQIALFGAKTQRFLTQALLTMNPVDLKEVANFSPAPEESVLTHWSSTCRGAMAAARVAHNLMANDIPVVFPTTHVDMNAQIDLIGLVKGRHTRHLCIQVKSHPRMHTHAINFATYTYRLNPDLLLIRDRVVEFGRQHDISCVPVLIRVNAQDFTEGELASKEILQPLLEPLIAYARS